MTIRTSLAVAAVAATAAIAVPAGWGQTGEARTTSDAIERAVLAREQAQRASALQLRAAVSLGAADAHERTGGESASGLPTAYRDAFERAALNEPTAGAATVTDSHDRVVLPGTPISAPTVVAGREIEWPQVGAGFLLALVLVAALWLPLRTTRSRPATH